MNSLIDIMDFDVNEIDVLIKLAEDIISNPLRYAEKCRGKKLATMFYEPSTRTRLSFEAAMYELGGNVISVADASNSSVAKGESVADTAKILSCYADIIAMRHPKEGAALVAANSTTTPIINAGDGGHSHPTQTLADLLTIHREKGRLSKLAIGICGDLKYGRTVHSLINALSRYEGIRFVLISPPELRLPRYIKTDVLDACDIPYIETASLEEGIASLDVLYMTRIQKERFDDPSEYDRLKGTYVLTPEILTRADRRLTIMHPLPRVDEISPEIDSDPRAAYFRQALNGKYIRMSLILKLLYDTPKSFWYTEPSIPLVNGKCTNPRCITSCEPGIHHEFKRCKDGTYKCIYCESTLSDAE